MVAQVFVSHSSKDRKVARTICSALESRGLSCWIASRDVGPGENFMEAIVRAIRAAKVMVLVFTENANNSDEIKREVVLASNNKVTVIPVRVEDVTPNDAFAYQFATRQWIDLFEDWEHQIERLTSWITGIVEVEPAASVTAPEAQQATVELQHSISDTPVIKADRPPVVSRAAETPVLPVTSNQPSIKEAVTSMASVADATPSSLQPNDFAQPPAADADALTKEPPPTDPMRAWPSRRAMVIAGSAAAVGIGGSVLSYLLYPLSNRDKTPSREAVRTFDGHSIIDSVAFSPDGRTALSGGAVYTLNLWDIATGAVIRTFSGHSLKVASVTFSPDGRTALSGSRDDTLKLWNIATGVVIRTFVGHSDGVNSVAFSPDGRTALSGSRDKTLKLWDIATGAVIRTFVGHSDGVSSITFSPDSRTTLSGSYDRTLKLWDIATGAVIRTFDLHSDGVSSVAISPDGRTVLSGHVGYGSLTLSDIATGAVIRTFQAAMRNVYSVAISPDGRTALAGIQDTQLRLWDIATGAAILILSGHSSTVASVAFSPDGRMGLSGDYDGKLKLWDLTMPAQQ